VLKNKVRRSAVLREVANLPACLIGIEACGGAHHWAREFSRHGHEVRLMAAQFVKGYVKSNQNDDQDAEAIGDAVGRANMRFVAVKTVEQRDLQAMHRIRPAAVKSRTALVNQMRGLLGEYGVVVPTGVGQMRQAVPELLEAGESRLSALMRSLLAQLYEHLQELDTRIQGYEAQLNAVFTQQEAFQRLAAIEGIGPLTATAVVGTFGDGRQFPNGRQFAAVLGRGAAPAREWRQAAPAGDQQTRRLVWAHLVGPRRAFSGWSGVAQRQARRAYWQLHNEFRRCSTTIADR